MGWFGMKPSPLSERQLPSCWRHHSMACWQFHKFGHTELVTIIPIFIITMVYVCVCVCVCVFVVLGLGLGVWGWRVSECMCHNF